MPSVQTNQTIVTRRFDTGQDNSAVDLGDFMVRPGLTLAGRVVFTDLKVPPSGTRLMIMPDNAGELFADVNETGRFDLRGLPEGPAYVWVELPQQGAGSPMVRLAYRLSHQNKCLDPTYPDRLQGTIHHDITDLTISLDTLFHAEKAAGLTEGQLLERFIQHRDEIADAAFEMLVDRHAPMVLRFCHQVLGDTGDAQDASQAAFLVLARRAGSIGRRESVANWLHGVAPRVAALPPISAPPPRNQAAPCREDS
jgi:Sigma-70 region 2